MKYQSVENWNKIIKPLLENSLAVCTTDINYIKEVENYLNKIDSLLISDPLAVAELVVDMTDILSTNQYYQNVHKSSSDEEKKMLRQVNEELSMFRKLVIYDFQNEEKEPPKEVKRLPNLNAAFEDVYDLSPKKRLI